MFKLIAKIIYLILVFIEALLITRFLLIMLDAPKNAWLYQFVLKNSEIFLQPVSSLASGSFYIGPLLIDTVTFVGILFYLLLAFIIVEVIKALSF